MDSPTYLVWLQFRLLPTLPGKRYLFILDNAKYHKARKGVNGGPWVSLSSMNKSQLAEVLKLWGVTSFTCIRQSKADLMQESKQTTHTFDFLTRAPRGPAH